MDRYTMIAISTILVVGLFVTFTSGEVSSEQYDYSGLVSEIEKSSKGYTFDLSTNDETIRCYYSEKPIETFYNVNGDFSDDEKIFFVSSMSIIE